MEEESNSTLRQQSSPHVMPSPHTNLTKFDSRIIRHSEAERETTPSDPSTTSPPFDDRNTVKMVSDYLDPRCVLSSVPAATAVLVLEPEEK